MSNSNIKSLESTLTSIEREDEQVYKLVTLLLIKLLKGKEVEVRDVIELIEYRNEYKEKIQKKISHHNTWKDYNTGK